MNSLDTSSSPWNKCGVFLINLDRSPERLALATENFAKVGMPFQRVAGFDASIEDVVCVKLTKQHLLKFTDENPYAKVKLVFIRVICGQ